MRLGHKFVERERRCSARLLVSASIVSRAGQAHMALLIPNSAHLPTFPSRLPLPIRSATPAQTCRRRPPRPPPLCPHPPRVTWGAPIVQRWVLFGWLGAASCTLGGHAEALPAFLQRVIQAPVTNCTPQLLSALGPAATCWRTATAPRSCLSWRRR